MAIHVEDTGQYVEATSAPAIGSLFGHAFTFAALYRPTTLDSGTVLGVGSSSTSQYVALAMLDTGQGFLEVNGKDAFAPSNFSDGDWHSLVGVQSGATSRVFYADGVAGTANTDDADPASDVLDRTTAGMLALNGNHVSTARGDIAEVAIWSVALTADEAAMLAARVCPLLVRPAALEFYSPLWGIPPGPELDLVGGRPLVYGGLPGVGVPTAAAHPGVAMPASVTLPVPAEAATTHEFAAWASSWTTLGRQSASWASSWATRARQSASWATGYEARQRLLSTWSSAYACRARLSGSWASGWTGRARGAASWQSGWATGSRGLGGWSTSYAVHAHPTAHWASSYVVASPMIALAARRAAPGRLAVTRGAPERLEATHD